MCNTGCCELRGLSPQGPFLAAGDLPSSRGSQRKPLPGARLQSASSWLLDDSVLTAWSGPEKLLAVAKKWKFPL